MPVIRADELERAPDPIQLDLLEQRATFLLTLDIAGVIMEVRSDDSQLCEALRSRYAAHISSKHKNFTYFVVRQRNGYLFWASHAAAWSWNKGRLPTHALVFLTDAVAISALVRFDPDLISYHAAAVEHAGRAAAIAGDSTAGKTTTSLACARLGMRVYSDERLLLRFGVAQRFLRACSVREDGARRLIADDPNDKLAAFLQRGAYAQLQLPEIFGPKVAATPQNFRTLFVLARTGSAHAQRISWQEAVPALTRWADGQSDRLALVGRTVALLKDVNCYRLSLGTPAETARSIVATLDAD